MTTPPPGPAQPSGSPFQYAPAPESRSIVDVRASYGLFVDGEFVDGSGEAMKTVNPATEEVLSEVAVGTDADVDRAVKAARRAFTRVWGPMRPADRGKYLFRIARLLQERAREFAVLESLDNGKPIRESRDVDVPLAAAHFFYHAGWADKLEHAGLGPAPRPLGVAGQVIPWNFPLLMLAWKVAPALATGNTVVLKPAETTPLTALLFAEVCRQADLPPGVVNIVTGAGETGRAVVEHPDVDKVAFTGSTEVGRSIARAVAGTRKKLTLELGGKAANIVFDDAPVDQAVEGIVQGIFFNQGHVCCAGSRLLVQENVHDEVIEALQRRIGTLRVGDPLDKNTDLGAINSAEQLQRIRELSDAGEAEGATRWQPACDLPDRGFWFPPTVFTGVSTANRIARDEVFGPVLSVLTFRTPDEAIAKANNSTYGLSAGIWSEKGSRILAVADRLRAGVVWANTFNQFDPTSPFGGYKQSGYGREGGRHGLAAYLMSTGADSE
ncbi:aldehyde dehydrogenase family protein [Blastococcus sp. SYSU D00695]